MAGYSSQSGQVIFKTQATPGTYDPATGTDGISVKLRSGSLGPNRDLLIPDPEIGGGRDIPDALLGAVSWAGDFEFYARLKFLPTFLAACLGTPGTPTTTTGITTHTITPVDSGTLPYLSVEESVSDGLEVYNYTDAVANTFHLEAEANGYLMGTVGLIAARQTAGETRSVAPPEDTSPLIVGTNILITYNGVTVPAKSFNLDVNNNIEDDDFRLGSFYLGGLVAKRREVTASVTLRPESSATWRQAVYGTSSATQPGGVTTKQPLVITCTSYENIPGGTPTTPYTLTLTIPKAIFSPFAFGPSGDDVIETDVDIQALRPALGTPVMTAAVKTDQDTIV